MIIYTYRKGVNLIFPGLGLIFLFHAKFGIEVTDISLAEKELLALMVSILLLYWGGPAGGGGRSLF